jgi:hypothetical protein
MIFFFLSTYPSFLYIIFITNDHGSFLFFSRQIFIFYRISFYYVAMPKKENKSSLTYHMIKKTQFFTSFIIRSSQINSLLPRNIMMSELIHFFLFLMRKHWFSFCLHKSEKWIVIGREGMLKKQEFSLYHFIVKNAGTWS